MGVESAQKGEVLREQPLEKVGYWKSKKSKASPIEITGVKKQQDAAIERVWRDCIYNKSRRIPDTAKLGLMRKPLSKVNTI